MVDALKDAFKVERKKSRAIWPKLIVGAWTILHQKKYRNTKNSTWICQCKCGNIREVKEYTLQYKKSAGCEFCIQKIKKENIKHGYSKHPLYARWKIIIGVCYDKKYKQYKNYGAKGIKVSKRWHYGDKDFTGFECFLKDMGFKDSKKLKRLDTKSDFTKENLIWSD